MTLRNNNPHLARIRYVNRTSKVLSSMLVLLATNVIGGCSWFHHKTDYYSKAAETRPLEVPPDLDTPVTSKELIVPPASASATGVAAAAPVNTAPPAAAASTAAVGAGVVSTGSLQVADSPDHTWQRVGLALERAQIGTISERDQTGRSYTVEVAGLGAVEQPAAEEHHWYTRILHPFGGDSKPQQAMAVSGHLSVRVSADGSGARVTVEAGSTDSSTSEAARRVMEVLRERLS
jgi:uncharacterized lipoprotein